MHEFSLLKGIIERLEQISAQEGGARIAVVRVTIGALAHISPEHLREHFEHAARGGIADGAELEITENLDREDPMAQEIVLESVDVETPTLAPASETIH
jgi:hydrogenase nickel incorporation protein HypA/HybF